MNEDGGDTNDGKVGKKIDDGVGTTLEEELGDDAAGAAVSPGAGAPDVADGADESPTGEVSPGIELSGIESPISTEVSEVEPSDASSLPNVLYRIMPTPTSRTTIDIGVSAFFHMAGDSSTSQTVYEPTIRPSQFGGRYSSAVRALILTVGTPNDPDLQLIRFLTLDLEDRYLAECTPYGTGLFTVQAGHSPRRFDPGSIRG